MAPALAWAFFELICVDVCRAATCPREVAARYHRAAIVADEIRVVKHAANQHSVVFILGHTHVVLPKHIPFWRLPRRILLELPFKVIYPDLPWRS